jgi:HEAT repeat protein
MTEDTSPENLRKFLESDDPAMVRMGMSMAEGSGIDITVKDLEHFLKSEDNETIKTGFTLAEEAGVGDEAMDMLCGRLADGDCIRVLGNIGDKRAIEPLIKVLNDGDGITDYVAAEALGNIGAVEPLIKALEDKMANHRELISAIEQTGDVGALCRVLEAYNWHLDWEMKSEYMEILADTGDPRALGVIWCDWNSSKDRRWYRQAECVAIWCYSAEEDSPEYESALNYLTSILGRLYYLEVKFPSGDKAVDALIRVIQKQVDDVGFGWSHDPRYYAAIELGEMGDTRAVEPLIKTLEDDDEDVRNAAKEALKKLGHEVE